MEGWRQRRLDSEELIGCAHFSRCCYLIIDLGSHLHLGGSRQKFSPVILDGGLHEVFELVSRWRVTVLTVVSTLASHVQESPVKFAVRWDKVTKVSRTTPTLQVVVNPPLRCGTPVHDNAFQALHDLGADYVRYVPWLPYPHLGVAELEPPKDGKTSWDFSLIDPMTIDFLEATKGHSVVLNFSTIPQWMYKTDEPVTYPDDPNKASAHLNSSDGNDGHVRIGWLPWQVNLEPTFCLSKFQWLPSCEQMHRHHLRVQARYLQRRQPIEDVEENLPGFCRGSN